MATKNHQKLDGAAKRSGRTTRTRSLAAIVAGATLSGALAAGGALGFIGEAKAITALSGTTFLDLNGNGQLDAAPDRLIGGVTVTAFDISGANAGQVVSLSNGTWEMAANGSGPYRIEFSNLPKSTYEGFSTQVTNLQFSNTGASFGLYAKLNGLGEIDDVVDSEPVQIGDRVWLDNNSNGIQDQGEPGIPGVRVELLIDGGPYIENGQPRTSTTDGNGNYVFSNIAPNRNYSIRVAAGQAPLANYTLTTQKSGGSTRYNDSDPALVGDDALAVAVAPKLGADMSYDFGYKPKPTLYCVGDQVWEDINKDGLFNNGEPGIGNVNVTLIDNAGNPVAGKSAVTAANGTWSICGLANGDYRVRFTKPVGYEFTKQATAANDGQSSADANGVSLPGTVKDKDCVCLDAGLVKIVVVEPKVSLGDTVWLDGNRDGIKQDSESTLAGYTVTLLDQNGNPVAGVGAQVTGENGQYLFTNLNKGTYRVRFNRPAASVNTPTTAKQGGNDITDSDAVGATDNASATTGVIDLQADNRNVDSGWVAPIVDPTVYCVGDQVWEDTNKDGLFSAGEPGIGGVNVTLIDNAGNPVAGKSAVTAANGTWNICGLANGDYRVRFTKPDGYEFTKQATAANDGQSSADANGVSLPGTVKDKNCVCLDAGLIKNVVAPKLKLGDLVFIDTDRDGRQTAVDTAVSGATVRLLNEAGTVIATTTTDANGKYLFTDLAPGKYQVQFTRPAGTTVTPTTVNVGDKENDSNARPQFEGTAITDVINLEADDLTIDAGWVTAVVAPTYCLGDLVFDDLNGNGIREDNEPGVNGVTVTVTNSAGGTGSTVTNNGGAWKICGLIAGDYTVAFTRPAGYEFTLQGSGNNRSNVDATGKTGKVTIVNADVLSVDAGVRLLPVIVVVQTTVPPVTVAPTTVAPVTTVAPAPVALCIGDKVFLDPTGAAKDGKGISGVTITLVRADGSTAAATTDSNGIYKFCSLGAGSYTVKVNPATLPAGAIPTYDLAGRKNNETTLSLTNADNVDVDFGYKLPAATVLAETITTAPAEVIDEPIAFTGSNTTTTMLWGLALLMIGMGIAGLMVDRRRNAFL